MKNPLPSKTLHIIIIKIVSDKKKNCRRHAKIKKKRSTEHACIDRHAQNELDSAADDPR